MTPEQFDELRDHAIGLHRRQAQSGPDRVSLDAIFLALAARAQRARKPAAPPLVSTPPEWFTTALQRHAGERMTVADLLLRAGRFPVTRRDAVDVGRWLRAAGKTARKSGGRQLFDL